MKHPDMMKENDTEPTGKVPRRAGRPPVLSEDERRAALLEAAYEVFVREGYAGATVEAIAQQAGMSKRTLYRFFRDKKQLLHALVKAHQTDSPPSAPVPDPEAPIRQELRNLLVNVLTTLLEPRQVALLRLVISETPNASDVTEEYLKVNLTGLFGSLNSRFAQLREAGAIRTANPEETAGLMLSAALGPLLWKALTSEVGTDVPEARIAAQVDAVLQVFAPTLLPPGA
ncbi:TetR/AcrR family transcriptional regulator [Pseudooceanicola sp. CBS1P-1]|uniref:TetR family transcriptional regulator n=2 Tax=Paracoccaceae TaxID=31989 RepID=A0A6L7FYI9_9RHOB|nr:TetR/AcrR family transcriptional regulator [Pseudooceanicola endophyticus]MXN17144.1 TetR family transcriptional regulator [Pseudooceanicola albus]